VANAPPSRVFCRRREKRKK